MVEFELLQKMYEALDKSFTWHRIHSPIPPKTKAKDVTSEMVDEDFSPDEKAPVVIEDVA